MAAVDKQNFILLSAHELENFFLLSVAVPDKSEIPAYDQHIAAAQLGEGFVLETGDRAVHIACHINHLKYAPVPDKRLIYFIIHHLPDKNNFFYDFNVNLLLYLF